MTPTPRPDIGPFDADEAFGRAVEAAKRRTFDTIRETCSKGGCSVYTGYILEEPRVRAEVLAELCKLGYEVGPEDPEDGPGASTWHRSRWFIKW